MTTPRRVTVTVPGSIGNVGPGLDILGLAVTGPGDAVTAETGPPGITVLEAGHADLPVDPARHASAIAAAEVLRRAGHRDIGLVLRVRKGLPLAGGQGGSAASAVAGAVAANALLDWPLDERRVLEACLEAEAIVAGRHADNVAPSLIGGAVLVRALAPLDVVRLPCPPLVIVLALPAQQLRTADARAVLPANVSRAVALEQAANVAAMVAAFASGDLALLGRALDDRIAEPARAPLLPGFAAAKEAALAAGAIGASISGAGPTAFALCADEPIAERVATAMAAAYRSAGLACGTRIAQVDRAGARVEFA